MEKVKPQDFKHHGRFLAPFHFFVLPVLLINVIYRLVELKNGMSFGSIWEVFVALALLMLALAARVMALSVQDRVIRLEERLRLERLLPADLRPRAGEFTVEQLIGLRFASDEELPMLCRQVLDEKVADRKTIESRIKAWRPDYARA
jgi:hypothetical protein